METIMRMLGNTWTTVAGIAAAFAYYVSQNGGKLPETKQQWWAAAVAVFIAMFGIAAKDATTGSFPGADH